MILNRSTYFKDPDKYSNPDHLFPIVKEQDFGDGTYLGHLDLEKMSPKQKLIGLATMPPIKFRPNAKGQVIAI